MSGATYPGVTNVLARKQPVPETATPLPALESFPTPFLLSKVSYFLVSEAGHRRCFGSGGWMSLP